MMASPLLLRDIGEAARAAGRENLSPELAILLTDREVPEEIQGWLGSLAHPVHTMSSFARADETSAGMREWLRADLGLEAARGIGHRMAIAALLDAWEAARKRSEAIATEEALSTVAGQPKKFLKGAFTALRRDWARLDRDMSEEFCPGQDYVERRLLQIETGGLKAEPLSGVISLKEEQEADSGVTAGQFDLRTDGTMHLIKAKTSSSLPVSPEGSRTKYDIMTTHWLIVKSRAPASVALRGLCA